MIEESENHGEWSNSKNKDDRIKGGYEAVPTQDIHFNQMGFGDQWSRILRDYVAPIAEANYVGYNFRGSETLDFIVKYKAEGVCVRVCLHVCVRVLFRSNVFVSCSCDVLNITTAF